MRLRGDGNGALVESLRLRVVPGRFVQVALASEHASAQTLSLGVRQKSRRLRNFLFSGRGVAFGLVVAKEETSANLEIGVRLLCEKGQGRFGIPLARLGIDSHAEHATFDQRLRGHRLCGRCNAGHQGAHAE